MLATISKIQSPIIQPIMDSGHNVLVLPMGDFGMFKLPVDRAPIELPLQTANVGTPTNATTGSIAALTATQSPSHKTLELTQLDLGENDLAQLRFLVLDPGIRVQVNQPGVNSKFDNIGTGVLYWEFGNTVPFFNRQLWSMIPEVFIMGGKNRITLDVYNIDFEENKDLARIAFFGYKYPLVGIEPDDAGDQYLTVQAGVVKS